MDIGVIVQLLGKRFLLETRGLNLLEWKLFATNIFAYGSGTLEFRV